MKPDFPWKGDLEFRFRMAAWEKVPTLPSELPPLEDRWQSVIVVEMKDPPPGITGYWQARMTVGQVAIERLEKPEHLAQYIRVQVVSAFASLGDLITEDLAAGKNTRVMPSRALGRALNRRWQGGGRVSCQLEPIDVLLLLASWFACWGVGHFITSRAKEGEE